jgi:neutral ceramidase
MPIWKGGIDLKKEVPCYEIGTSRFEMNPPLTIPYLAGNPRHSFFTGIHDPLYVCAAVIFDGHQEVALVSIDSIGFNSNLLGEDKDFFDELKERIEQETGIKKHNVMLLSGHIHSAPDTLAIRPLSAIPDFLPWLEKIMTQICSAIHTASGNKFKANLKIGKGNAVGLTRNRRGEAFLDPEVIVLLFESLDKEHKVILVNYACHPVIVQVQDMMSADFIGAMRDALKERLMGMKDCLFIQGACGDINPAVGATQNFADVYSVGQALAIEVVKVYDNMMESGYAAEPVQIKAISQMVTFPSRALPSQEETDKLQNEMDDLNRKLVTSNSSQSREAILQEIGAREEALWRIREGYSPFHAEIQLIRLGNGVLVGIPGEPMCKMGLHLKETFKPLVAIPAGYSNGHLAYIASPEDWQKGGYEVELGPWSKVGPESYEIVLRTIESLMETAAY